MNLFKQISRSDQQTPNSRNPECQYPQFKVLQSGFFFLIYQVILALWVYFDINLKLLSGKNTQKINKQKIQDS